MPGSRIGSTLWHIPEGNRCFSIFKLLLKAAVHIAIAEVPTPISKALITKQFTPGRINGTTTGAIV